MKSYVTISLGCKVNSYEVSALVSRLKELGYVENNINPTVAIINTCSVTSTADQKSRQHIRKLITNYPNSIVAVMGCYSQGQHEFIAKEIRPNIVTGTSNRDKLVDLIENYQAGNTIDITDNSPRLFDKYEELGITNHSENVRAYLKIQDGCDNFCSYCLIPFRRGKARSRSHQNILKEANYLVESGYKEIVLTGIHVGGYGKDLENESFSSLVQDIVDIKDLYRLRISSIEESEIDEKLIELINTRNNLANHFHIPLQSGSDTVLKRMNRKYNKEQFFNKISEIKKACPNVALTTDVIVGFPGESEDEFLESYEFIKKCGFNMLHVFPFSSREGTLASRMPNHVDPKIKKERTLKLIELSNSLWEEYTNQFVGKEVEVLIEQYDEKNHLNIGHTSNYIEVKIQDFENNVGKIVKTIYKK
ncbi:MAG: tRNA (N(6)-L-threonylcarbamoyladenosine(37)-C(2))-methylthiotransferase MtaB [Bacilli bacterium]|nr:tRNA (N(6)-L-threonylcarbamoyladenosine(37)-C(2))-methylthiotransferase MtaB [Bacilli bacterium]